MVNGPGNLPDLRQIPALNPAAPITPKIEQKFPLKPAEVKPEPAAEVTLSPRAKELQVVLPKVKAIPEVRHDRVEEVRVKLSGVANGAALNAKVAEKLLTGN